MADRQAEFMRLVMQQARRILGVVPSLRVNRSDADDMFQNTSVALRDACGLTRLQEAERTDAGVTYRTAR
jgi:hypothetical protein